MLQVTRKHATQNRTVMKKRGSWKENVRMLFWQNSGVLWQSLLWNRGISFSPFPSTVAGVIKAFCPRGARDYTLFWTKMSCFIILSSGQGIEFCVQKERTQTHRNLVCDLHVLNVFMLTNKKLQRLVNNFTQEEHEKCSAKVIITVSFASTSRYEPNMDRTM